MEMKRYRYVLSFLLAGLSAAGMNAQGAKYPPLSEYMMARDYLKLMEKYQNTDPFKYILYSAKIGEQTPPMVAIK